MKTHAVLAGLLFATCLSPLVAAPTDATPNAPLHESVGKPLTPVTDVLTDLARQSGVPILFDDTVIDTLGVTTLDKPSVEGMLSALVPLGQGLSWQRVYLPQDAPLPDGTTLAAEVHALKSVAQTGLVVADPATPGALSFSKSVQSAPSAPPAGMKTVYLVTNEVVRAQRLADQKAAAQKQPAPVDHAVAGMQTAADDLGRMTPDEQRQAIPLMMQQMMRMFQSIDPGVRQEMGEMWRQNRAGGGGAPGQ